MGLVLGWKPRPPRNPINYGRADSTTGKAVSLPVLRRSEPGTSKTSASHGCSLTIVAGGVARRLLSNFLMRSCLPALISLRSAGVMGLNLHHLKKPVPWW